MSLPNLAGLIVSDGPDARGAAAARESAHQLRRDVLCRQGVLFDRSGRTGMRDLKALAAARDVRSVEFDAPMASEGELVPLATGGFLIRVARSAGTNRARFTVAHEIAHTFFYDNSFRPPRRIDERPLPSFRSSSTVSVIVREEMFCDQFASELLLPTEETRSSLMQFASVENGHDFVQRLERTAAAQAVSVRMLLIRLNQLGFLPRGLMSVVLIVRQHMKTGCDEELRVAEHHSASRCWFVPSNQRAETIGFIGAQGLVSWWDAFDDRDTARTYRRSGVASFDANSGEGTRRVVANQDVSSYLSEETLLLWNKDSAGRWKHLSALVPVLYRFYAAGVVESYCLSVIDVRDAVVRP